MSGTFATYAVRPYSQPTRAAYQAQADRTIAKLRQAKSAVAPCGICGRPVKLDASTRWGLVNMSDATWAAEVDDNREQRREPIGPCCARHYEEEP